MLSASIARCAMAMTRARRTLALIYTQALDPANRGAFQVPIQFQHDAHHADAALLLPHELDRDSLPHS